MRKSIIVILAALVIISIIIPASAYIAPINATWVPPGNTYSGWVPSRAIDGNTGTQAVMDSGGRIRLYFASGAENATITSCDVFARPDAGGILGFTEANHTNALWRKSYPAGSGWGTFTFPVAQTGKYLDIGQEDGGWLYLMEVRCSGWNATYSDYGDPTFTGYPLDGYSPLEVSFTIQNTTMINATGTSWTFGDGQTSSSTTSIVNHTYQNPGIYTVSMQYFNQTGGSVTITRTNYVLASIPSGMIVNLDVKNAITGALIQDSTVSIRNVTTGVWRNTTAPTGLVYFSTTDPGYLYPLSQNQTITLAANKSGYRDASETFAIPYNNYRARLFLMPTSITNATGAGTVVVNVVRNKDGLTVSGMSVVMDSGQIGITNGAGAVTLYNVTAGDRVVKVTDPDGAYQDTEKSITLTAGETKLVVIQVVLEGESPVDTPVTPTVTGTFDPSDPSSYGEYGNYTAPQMNEAGGFVILQMLGQLFSLWPLVVMGIFFKFMKSAFS